MDIRANGRLGISQDNSKSSEEKDMDSILAYDPTSHPDDKPPDYVSSRPRRLSPDEAKLDELSNYAKPYLRNGNFHEVIGILGGTTLREFNKCREGKTIPPYIRSSDPRSHNVHHKVDEVNNQGSNDNKSLQEAHSDDSDKRTSKKSSLSSNTGLERNKSIKKERHYDGNQEIESTSDQALSSSYHRGVPSDRKVKTEISNGPDSCLPSALSSSYHRGVPSDRKVKTEISNGPDSFLPSVSNETIAKTTTLSKRNQGQPSANNDFCVADDTKTSQNKEDTKTKDEDELLQASENNNKIKRQKADNDTKATTVRPKELKIDIIQNGIAKGMIQSTSDEKVSMIAKVKQICEEMVGLPPPISAIRTPSSSSSAFPAFQQKDEATSNRKDIKKESEENNFTDDQNCLEQDLELTDDSDSDNQSDAVEDLTRNGNNAISGKLFPIIDPTPLSESSSESDNDSDIGAVKQVKKRKTPSSDNRKHSPRQKKTPQSYHSAAQSNRIANNIIREVLQYQIPVLSPLRNIHYEKCRNDDDFGRRSYDSAMKSTHCDDCSTSHGKCLSDLSVDDKKFLVSSRSNNDINPDKRKEGQLNPSSNLLRLSAARVALGDINDLIRLTSLSPIRQSGHNVTIGQSNRNNLHLRSKRSRHNFRDTSKLEWPYRRKNMHLTTANPELIGKIYASDNTRHFDCRKGLLKKRNVLSPVKKAYSPAKRKRVLQEVYDFLRIIDCSSLRSYERNRNSLNISNGGEQRHLRTISKNIEADIVVGNSDIAHANTNSKSNQCHDIQMMANVALVSRHQILQEMRNFLRIIELSPLRFGKAFKPAKKPAVFVLATDKETPKIRSTSVRRKLFDHSDTQNLANCIDNIVVSSATSSAQERLPTNLFYRDQWNRSLHDSDSQCDSTSSNPKTDLQHQHVTNENKNSSTLREISVSNVTVDYNTDCVDISSSSCSSQTSTLIRQSIALHDDNVTCSCNGTQDVQCLSNTSSVLRLAKIDNTSEKEENKAAADQHNELFEDVDNSDQQQQQRSPIQNDAVVSSTLPPTADKSYPVSFDLSRLKSIKLSTSKAKKHQDEQAQGFKDKKINVDKQLTSTSGSKDGSLSSGISKSKRINNHNNEGHPLKKKIRNKMAESSDEANVTAVSSRKGISPERNEMKRNKKSDDFKVVSHGKVSEKERLKKASRSIIGSEDDSALLRHKKDKKRKKEIRRVKTSDDDSSSHHRTPPPFKNDNDQSEVQDRGKNCDYKASQSKHLDSDNTQRRKKSVAKESNKDYRSDMAATTFNKQTLKKNTEEVSTIEDLRIKSENLRKQATEHKRSGDANPNIEVKAIKYTEAAMLFIEQALIEEKLDKEKHESRKKEPYYEILNTTATFLNDRSRALLVHKIFLRSRNEIRTLLQNVNEYCAKDKQQMGSISKKLFPFRYYYIFTFSSRTSDLSVSPTFTPGSQSSTSSSSTQNDNFISIPNKIMSMQLRLNHLWNQETYAMDLWENGNLIMKEFEDFFTQLHQRNILHYDSTLADLLNYVRRGMKLISKN
ncbi:uncharacterized protein TRIADDRAFT_56732 [Trichoplax adhaerens]|uniref:AF4/FMR2 family member lilli n=1 Tax=Trichoplax adhaerens TaxID=10228 RepID=B3RWF7_TRIAD|nr:hypothetical protein TRIADDRAFT_56732 [Trichoplax adhaerens]EDV25127.1 hypothetical protein TRIADDRAFT_56732 [Trichoplax adhaerens]|eukprot:XP_002113017.1 hypothetical protein TRIADDRAFT_56732 [Trichoplax adhaerens]